MKRFLRCLWIPAFAGITRKQGLTLTILVLFTFASQALATPKAWVDVLIEQGFKTSEQARLKRFVPYTSGLPAPKGFGSSLKATDSLVDSLHRYTRKVLGQIHPDARTLDDQLDLRFVSGTGTDQQTHYAAKLNVTSTKGDTVAHRIGQAADRLTDGSRNVEGNFRYLMDNLLSDTVWKGINDSNGLHRILEDSVVERISMWWPIFQKSRLHRLMNEAQALYAKMLRLFDHLETMKKDMSHLDTEAQAQVEILRNLPDAATYKKVVDLVSSGQPINKFYNRFMTLHTQIMTATRKNPNPAFTKLHEILTTQRDLGYKYLDAVETLARYMRFYQVDLRSAIAAIAEKLYGGLSRIEKSLVDESSFSLKVTTLEPDPRFYRQYEHWYSSAWQSIRRRIPFLSREGGQFHWIHSLFKSRFFWPWTLDKTHLDTLAVCMKGETPYLAPIKNSFRYNELLFKGQGNAVKQFEDLAAEVMPKVTSGEISAYEAQQAFLQLRKQIMHSAQQSIFRHRQILAGFEALLMQLDPFSNLGKSVRGMLKLSGIADEHIEEAVRSLTRNKVLLMYPNSSAGFAFWSWNFWKKLFPWRSPGASTSFSLYWWKPRIYKDLPGILVSQKAMQQYLGVFRSGTEALAGDVSIKMLLEDVLDLSNVALRHMVNLQGMSRKTAENFFAEMLKVIERDPQVAWSLSRILHTAAVQDNVLFRKVSRSLKTLKRNSGQLSRLHMLTRFRGLGSPFRWITDRLVDVPRRIDNAVASSHNIADNLYELAKQLGDDSLMKQVDQIRSNLRRYQDAMTAAGPDGWTQAFRQQTYRLTDIRNAVDNLGSPKNFTKSLFAKSFDQKAAIEFDAIWQTYLKGENAEATTRFLKYYDAFKKGSFNFNWGRRGVGFTSGVKKFFRSCTEILSTGRGRLLKADGFSHLKNQQAFDEVVTKQIPQFTKVHQKAFEAQPFRSTFHRAMEDLESPHYRITPKK